MTKTRRRGIGEADVRFIHGFVNKANLPLSVFSGNFVTDNGSLPSIVNNYNAADKLNDIIFTPVLIERVLIFLKSCSAQLCKPLADLFSCSFNCAYLPEDWLRSYITPHFKTGPDNLILIITDQ